MSKLRIILLYIMSILLVIVDCSNAMAQNLSTSGEWDSGISISGNKVINLTGNLYIKGEVTVSSGNTLTINNNTGHDITITYGGSSGFFNVGGKLIINGTSNGRIILDGGADFTLNKEEMTMTSGTEKKIARAIRNTGRVELNYVTIQNVYGSDNNGGALEVAASGTNKGTYLTNCIIQKCRSLLGSAMMLEGSAPAYITDSQIIGCFTGGGTVGNSGGAIRTYGGTGASLYLTRVKFYYNYALRNSSYKNTIPTDGNGAAIFWNAKGSANSKCVIEECEFAYNKSDDNGGAIKSQASLIFTGKPTKFHDNTAPVGAAIYIEGYTGSIGGSATPVIVYDLNSSLEIYNNHSPNYEYKGNIYPGQGAGIHFFFGSGMTLQEGTKIQVNLKGAKIYSNTAGNENGNKGQGGGIYFENTSVEGKYPFEINMDYGEVTENISYGQGGGIYFYTGTINSQKIDNNALVITSNNAKEGAGLYIKNGNLILANGTIEENRTIAVNNVTGASGNGAGIYINNGNFTITEGTVSNNFAENGFGGGVYIEGTNGKGIFTMSGGEIASNHSTENGGGIYINGGQFIQSAGNISGNYSEANGGGICIVNGGTFTMNGGNILNNGIENNNIHTEHGGGVYLNGGNFVLTSGTISGNASKESGGGVFLTGENCRYELQNGDIKENSAKYGGGVYLENGLFILGTRSNPSNGNISGNEATKGAGVYIGSVESSEGTTTAYKASSDVILEPTEGFVMYGGQITNNESDDNGGGIYLNGGDFTQYNGVIESNKSSENGGGIYLNGGTFNLSGGDILQNYGAKSGGGIYLSGGNFNLKNGDISENGKKEQFVTESGGGVFLSGGNFSQTGGTISDNISSIKGAGVCIIGGGSFTMTDGIIEDNGKDENGDIITSTGGGVYLDNGSFSLGSNGIADKGKIQNNGAENGGGVYLSGGSFSQNGGTISGNTSSSLGGGVCIVNEGTFNMTDGVITQNGKNASGGIATLKGGGVYLEDGNFTLGENGKSGNGTISSNAAIDGGGVYLNGGDFIQNNGSLTSNFSNKYGGGVCIVGGSFTINNGLINGNGKNASNETLTSEGGGVYINGGALTVQQGKILSNASLNYGGGLYILNGTVNMGAGYIETNSCGKYGGGVYVYNSSNDELNVEINGGIIQQNNALYGGGLCVNGKINLTIGNVQIIGNNATNGGGVCLMNEAKMNFGEGQITFNNANKSENKNFKTGYQMAIGQVEGLGGGIYLDSKTQLKFSSKKLGLFGNIADNGADELFANGNNTLVDIPDVEDMSLTGFTGGGNLRWIEDYMTNDEGYMYGTNLLGYPQGTKNTTNQRYRDMIQQNTKEIPQLDGELIETDAYICFALGYEVIFVTITKEGLEYGESAIFTLNKTGSTTPPVRIIITGVEKDGNGEIPAVSKKVAVTAGKWTVTETPWSWTYTPSVTSITKDDVADINQRNFVFSNTKINTKLPLNHEKGVSNTMGGSANNAYSIQKQ